jgi:hypothetical protein
LQLGPTKIKGLEDVPLAQDFARTPDERKVLDLMMTMKSLGRPFMSGPGVPADRISILRGAFDATMRDSGYVADVKRSGGTLDPTSGAQMQTLLETVYAAPPALIARAKAAMAP